MSETWVRSLGWDDPPEEGMATLSSILAWRIPWTEEPGGLQSMGSQEWNITEQLSAAQQGLGWAFPVAQTVKNLPAMPEIWVRSLGWDDPQEKGMATYFSILVWRIPWTEEPMGLRRVGHD